MKLTVNAPAKINLFLDIVGRLDNGYHSLFMIMQAVGLADTVTVEAAESGIELSCSLPKLVLRSAPKSSRMRRSGRISVFV